MYEFEAFKMTEKSDECWFVVEAFEARLCIAVDTPQERQPDGTSDWISFCPSPQLRWSLD